jgi:hypothetical protein
MVKNEKVRVANNDWRPPCLKKLTLIAALANPVLVMAITAQAGDI